MILLPVLAKMIGGSFTGYLTNLLAIKMLFKEYGPFGGVILKTKDDFIIKTSKLVEREVINHKTLEGEMVRQPFRDAFQGVIQDLLQIELKKRVKTLQWRDFKGMEESLENLFHLLEVEGPYLLNHGLPLLQLMDLKDLLGKDQLPFIINSSYSFTLSLLKERSSLEDLLIGLYREGQGEKIHSFIPEDIFRKVAHNVNGLTTHLHEELRTTLDGAYDDSFSRIYDELNISKILQDLEEKIYQKTLGQLLGEGESKPLSKELLEKVIKMLKTPKGEAFLEDLSITLIKICKELDLSLLQLLTPNLKRRLMGFLEQELPLVIQKILQWIEGNRNQLEVLIDETVEEILEAGSGLKNWVKKKISESFSSISQEFEIINRVLTGVEERVEPHLLVEEITSRILGVLEEKTIGELVSFLEETGVLGKDLASFLLKQLESLCINMDGDFLQEIFKRELRDFMPGDLMDPLYQEVKDYLGALGKEFFYQKDKVHQYKGKLINSILDFPHKGLSHILSEDHIKSTIHQFNEFLLTALEKEGQTLVTSITEEAFIHIEKENLYSFMDQQLLDPIHRVSLVKMRSFIEKVKDTKIETILHSLEDKDGFTYHLTDLLLILLKNNMESLVSGRIEYVVAENLYSLSDEEIQRTVEEFIGTELKPITTLGAMMGSLAGLGLFFVQGTTFPLPPLYNYLLSAFIYGGIGFVTNKVAIQMVFKPYEKKEILGFTIPFTPGLVAKNKPRFAKGLGQFIQETLLTPDSVKEFFRGKREDLQDSFIDLICKDNYQLVQELLEKNRDFFVDYSLNTLISWTSRNKECLAKELGKTISSISIKSLYPLYLERGFSQRGQNLLLRFHEGITDYLHGHLKESTPIKGVIPAPFWDYIDRILEEGIRGQLHDLMLLLKDSQQLEGLIDSQWIQQGIHNFLEGDLQTLLGDKKEEIQSKLLHYLMDFLQSKEHKRRFLDFFEDVMIQELQPQRRINSLFNGLFQRMMIENIDFLLQYLYQFSLGALQENRELLLTLILNSIHENLTFTQKIAFLFLEVDDTIKEVVHELVDYRIPLFFQNKRDELQEVLLCSIEGFGEKRVEELGIILDRKGIEEVISSLFHHKTLLFSLKTFFSHLFSLMAPMKVKSLLGVTSLTNPIYLKKIFLGDIEDLGHSLSKELIHHEDFLIREFSQLIKLGLNGSIFSLPLQAILEGISREDIFSFVNQTSNFIQSSEYFSIWYKNMEEVFWGELDRMVLGDFLHGGILQEDLIKTLSSLLSHQNLPTNLTKALEQLVILLIQNFTNILTAKTRNNLLHLLVDSSFSSFENNFLQILQSIHIEGITQEQIYKMDPKEIEDLFYSFADQYLKRVIRFGWAGGGIGLFTEFISRLFL